MRRIELENSPGTSFMLDSFRRHARTVAGYLTPRKLANGAVLAVEMAAKRPVLLSMPCYIRVEVSPYCNLSCPGCALGGADLPESSPEHRKERPMSLELFERSVKDLLPYLVKVNLYDEGEPLLNKSLPEMIAHLHRNRVATCVSTNLSLRISDEYMSRLLSSGLDHLVVALDGITQETYSTYRRGGNLSLVIENLERLAAMQKALHASPKVEIQFLDFPHNKGDRQGVRDLAERLGAWRFCVIENCSPLGWEGSRFRGTEEERRRRGCYQLWIASTINSAGEVGCCDYGEDHGIPNVGMASDYASGNLRNHPSLVQLRRSFRRGAVPLHPVCRGCSLYRRRG